MARLPKKVVINGDGITISFTGGSDVEDLDRYLQTVVQERDAALSKLANVEREAMRWQEKATVIAESASDYYDQVQMLKARLAEEDR